MSAGPLAAAFALGGIVTYFWLLYRADAITPEQRAESDRIIAQWRSGLSKNPENPG